MKVRGPAPVPPSPPSMVMKSTPRSSRLMRSASSIQKSIWPTAALMPIGSPLLSARVSTKSSISSTPEKARCSAGLMQSLPAVTPRMAAMCGVTLIPGRTPPRPGLAPWESLSSTARTGAPSTHARKRSMSKLPSSVRHPKYPVPICQISSPPCRWKEEMPPSPLLCRQGARALPRFRASTAGPDSEP